MAHYLFHVSSEAADEPALRASVIDQLMEGHWTVSDDEPRRGDLAAGDHVLVYLAAPHSVFVGRAVLASRANAHSGDVQITDVEEWDPPISMADVLPLIDRSEGASGEFDRSLLRITEKEYDTAVSVAHR